MIASTFILVRDKMSKNPQKRLMGNTCTCNLREFEQKTKPFSCLFLIYRIHNYILVYMFQSALKSTQVLFKMINRQSELMIKIVFHSLLIYRSRLRTKQRYHAINRISSICRIWMQIIRWFEKSTRNR